MSASEFVPVAAAVVAIVGAVTAFVQNRRKPQLDSAQADAVAAQVKKTNAEINRDRDELNLHRDRRVLDLEKWADKMRPAMWARDTRIDLLTRLVIEDHEALDKPVPEMEPLPMWPEFPEPRPLPQ